MRYVLAAICEQSFLIPCLGCASSGIYASWTGTGAEFACGRLVLAATSVVYTVMMEFGFNKTDFGKTILAGCVITDLGTAIGLGLIFAYCLHHPPMAQD